ncbi:hypothetical protein L218DRAFT_991612 [Marasmius fiardii PR-910]|nr:hypothetical protein L218DRAFT_991612 [Marasmius fiardii PR-910]
MFFNSREWNGVGEESRKDSLSVFGRTKKTFQHPQTDNPPKLKERTLVVVDPNSKSYHHLPQRATILSARVVAPIDPAVSLEFQHMATDSFTTQPQRSNSDSHYVYSQSQFRSHQPDRGLYTLDTELDGNTRPFSRLKRSKSGFTLKTVDGQAAVAADSSNASDTIAEEKQKGLSGLKKKMSTFFIRRNAKEMAEVIEGDAVPGCMPMTGLSKKKSFTLSKAPGGTDGGDHAQSRSRNNSLFGMRSRKLSSSSKQMLTILTDTTAPPSKSIDSARTDESTLIDTPQTPMKPHRVVSPPPLLPSPGISKDNSEMWCTSLMQQLEQQQHKKREGEVLRHSRSFSGFRSSMASWELDAMVPQFPGFVFPWQSRLGSDDVEDEDFGDVVVERGYDYASIEDDAESVYRACEAMGGTGIVF